MFSFIQSWYFNKIISYRCRFYFAALFDRTKVKLSEKNITKKKVFNALIYHNNNLIKFFFQFYIIVVIYIIYCLVQPANIMDVYILGPNAQLIGVLVGVMVSVCVVIAFVGCVCCQRRQGFKVFTVNLKLLFVGNINNRKQLHL